MGDHRRPSGTDGISRRRFLTLAGIGVGAAAFASTGIVIPTRTAHARLSESGERALTFVKLHTDEKLSAVYRRDGVVDPGALEDINYILRDWRTDEITEMDVETLDIVFELQHRLKSNAPVEVISGYRSPRTNAMLASKSGGVAKRSLHVLGKAIDIRLPDSSIVDTARTAFQMGRGGVGLYRRSGFVHVDSGRHRKWNF